MYCQKCGAQIPSNANFCNKCGAPVKKPSGENAKGPRPQRIVSDKQVGNKKPQRGPAKSVRKKPRKKNHALLIGGLIAAVVACIALGAVLIIKPLAKRKSVPAVQEENSAASTSTTEAAAPVSSGDGPVFAPELINSLPSVNIIETLDGLTENDLNARYAILNYDDGTAQVGFFLENTSDRVIKYTFLQKYDDWVEMNYDDVVPGEIIFTVSTAADPNGMPANMALRIEGFDAQKYIQEVDHQDEDHYNRHIQQRTECSRITSTGCTRITPEDEKSKLKINLVDENGDAVTEEEKFLSDYLQRLLIGFDQAGNVVPGTYAGGGYLITMEDGPVTDPVPQSVVKYMLVNRTSTLY